MVAAQLYERPRGAVGPPTPGRCLEVDAIGPTAVVRFTRPRLLTEATARAVGEQLFGLVEQEGHRSLVLSFANVDRLTVALLGQIIRLGDRLRALQGRLILCSIPPHLFEPFAVLGLARRLGIYPAEQEALQALEKRPA